MYWFTLAYCALHTTFLSFRTRWTVFGRARYLTSVERFRLINRWYDGVLIESQKRLKRDTSFKNLLMLSPTGFGKSTRFVIPNLLNELPDRPSLIITDPSLELFNKSAGYLAQFYDVRKLDFSGNSSTLGYNPLFNITGNRQIERLAFNLVSAANDKHKSDPFWQDKAIELVTVLIKCLLHPCIEDKYQNLGNVRLLLNEFGTDGKPLMNFFEKTATGLLLKEVLGILSQEPKILQGAIATAKAALRLWSNEVVCQITAANTVQFQEVRKKPVAIFVSVPESEMSYYQPLINQFYSDVFHFLLQMPKPEDKDVFVFLDEGGNMYLPDFETIVTVIRKRRVSLSVIMQSLSQLEAKYGRDSAKTILENIQNKIIAPGLDIEACEYVEKMLGKATRVYRNPANHWLEKFTNKPKQLTARPLMYADEFRRSKFPVFFSENKAATLLDNMLPYYQDQELLKRSQMKFNKEFAKLKPFGYLDINNI